jgi:hypothetical protein
MATLREKRDENSVFDKPTFLERVTTKAVLEIGRRLAFKRLLKGDGGQYERNIVPQWVNTEDEANLISSSLGPTRKQLDALHAPVLDIDFPAHLVPSSTIGHYHLYLDKKITWDKYKKLLVALADADILERGYVDAAINTGATYVRLPYVRKGKAR